MSLTGFESLFQHADNMAQPVEVSIAGAADRTVLEAVRIATDRRWIHPVLVGSEAEIRRVARQCDVNLVGWQIVDSEDAALAAVRTVRSGAARLLMKGQVATPELMRAVLDEEHGLRGQGVIAQVVLMEIVPAQRRLLLADTGICVQPTLEQKIEIVKSTIEVARLLNVTSPRIALMAATEKVTERMPETIEARHIQGLARGGEFPNSQVSGPLSFDLAYSSEAARRKRHEDPVAGRADVMIFPGLLSANLTVKAIMYTADCRFGGLLVGAACPVVFMSRADSAPTRLNSLAFALKMV